MESLCLKKINTQATYHITRVLLVLDILLRCLWDSIQWAGELIKKKRYGILIKYFLLDTLELIESKKKMLQISQEVSLCLQKLYPTLQFNLSGKY